ncbi:DedA family protein [Paenibacillus hamazuiensis]|uniref:DedA family protein n=1 Tax=Paenibacillus hamazuiensis TaxID=2936508 RepID=UPI00200C25C6|nr:DedA family protein [Paenibacillus hamazuiensis]
MTYDALLQMIQTFGYPALFFALWLGIVGTPIPDEVIVMTGGAVAAHGLLQPIPAFAVTYLGVVSGLSIGYVLGRYVGTPVLDRIRRKKKMGKYMAVSEKLIQKYGPFALFLSYFFPIVRHVLPYIVGSNRMPFGKYALYSYTTGLIWTGIFFMTGRMVGSHIQEVGAVIHHYGIIVLLIVLAAGIVWGIIKYIRPLKGRSLHPPAGDTRN